MCAVHGAVLSMTRGAKWSMARGVALLHSVLQMAGTERFGVCFAAQQEPQQVLLTTDGLQCRV